MAIPLCAGLAYIPHIVKGALYFGKLGLDYNNEAPRETKAEIVFSDSPALAAMATRCTGAHLNGIESMALFGPAIAFAVARGVSDAEIAKHAASFLTARAVYNVAYIAGIKKPMSFFRTATYAASVLAVLQLFVASSKRSA